MTYPLSADATDLALAIRRGELTALEAMQSSLAAADAMASLGAIARVDSALGIKAARAADERLSGGAQALTPSPFAGVPTLAKNLGGPFAGLPVTAGSRLFQNAPDTADSDLAARFRAAGLCLFGLTTSPEFGLSLASEPDVGPLCRNPLDPALTAGGSSGGAAASVAAGIVAIAHATDAGGSIRVPAACCGLVGLKPTRGAVPAGPFFGNHLGGIASELAVCRSVRDTALIFDCLNGKAHGPFADPAIDDGDSFGRLKIGVLTDTGERYPTESARLEAVEAAALALQSGGHAIIALDWRAFEAQVDASGLAFGHIIATNLANLFDALALDESKVEPLTGAFIGRGRALSATALWRALEGAVLVSRDLWRLFDTVDCLLMPMLSFAPPPIGSFPSDHRDPDLHLHRMTAFAPLAALANISGFPALTLPFGRDAGGLPLPVQMMAPMGRERLLLSIAKRLEAEERWQHRFPVAGLAA